MDENIDWVGILTNVHNILPTVYSLWYVHVTPPQYWLVRLVSQTRLHQLWMMRLLNSSLIVKLMGAAMHHLGLLSLTRKPQQQWIQKSVRKSGTSE